MRVLVTGGFGALGRRVVPKLLANGHAVRVASRRPSVATGQNDVELAVIDLATGDGLETAVVGVDAILHLATNPFRNTRAVDVLGTERLLARARIAGVNHLIYSSIVGIDRIPYSYYQHKLAAEKLVQGGGIPWSILRATQFHTLIDLALGVVARLPVLLLPTDFRFQLVDPSEVAERLARSVAEDPRGYLPEMAGPEIRSLGELTRAWLKTRRMRRLVLPLPLPGQVADGFRRGHNTSDRAERGVVTWQEWLDRRYGALRSK